LYDSPNIRVIKLRRLRWAGHIARRGKMRNAYNILVEKVEGIDHSEDLVVGEKILEWILRKWSGEVWIGCIWLRIGTSGGLL
jgi:hypothetical protein